MKVYIETSGVQSVVCDLSDTDIKLLRSEIKEDVLYEDIKRRLEWVLRHKIDVIEDDLRKYWVQKFMNDPFVSSIPADRVQFFDLVFKHPEFKFASQKDV
jgi:hypothetical protein